MKTVLKEKYGFVEYTADEGKMLTLWTDDMPVTDYAGSSVICANEKYSPEYIREIDMSRHIELENLKEQEILKKLNADAE